MNDNGNVFARGSDGFTYDQANRLTQATVGPNTVATAYDGDGKRVSKTVNGITTSHVYDINRKQPVVLDDGTRRYVWGLGNGLAYSVKKDDATDVWVYPGMAWARSVPSPI